MFSVYIKGRTIEEFNQNVMTYCLEVLKKNPVPDVNEGQMLLKVDEPAQHGSSNNKIKTYATVHKEALEAVSSVEQQPETLEQAFIQPFVQRLAEVVAPEMIKETVDGHETGHVYKKEKPTQATDARAIPWDARIHSMSRGLNKDGTWRIRRGVEQADVNKVEAELIKSQSVQANPVPYPAPPVAPIAPIYEEVPANPFTVVAPLPPEVVAAPAQVVPPVIVPPQVQPSSLLAHTLESFKANAIPAFMELTKSGKLTKEYLAAIKLHFGVKEVWDFSDSQLNEIFESFVKNGFITKVG